MGDSSVVARIVRGGLWLYLSTVVNNAFGFAYWLTISRIGGAEILGFTSATIGLASFASSLASLGVPIGMRRFLGAYSRDREALRSFFWTSLALLALLQGGVALAFLAMSVAGLGLLCFTPPMLRVAAILVALGISSGFSSLLVSTLRTDYLALATLIGNAAKLGLGVALVEMGFGWIGAATAYCLVSLSILAIGLRYLLELGIARPRVGLSNAIEVLKAGVATWIPGIVAIVGQQLAVLTVFGARGAVETGRFYVAFAIASFVSGVAGAMLGLLLPVLSSMERGRESTSFEVLKIGLVAIAPVTAAVALYPSFFLSLLGRSYVGASRELTILALAAFAQVPSAAISNLVYSYGMYREVLIAGLCQNVPRVALYAALVPRLGSFGAALSYTLGSYAGLAYLATLAARRRYFAGRNAKALALAAAIPLAVASALLAIHVPPLPAVAIVVASYGIYARLGVVKRSEIKSIARAFASERAVDRAYRALKPLIDALVPE